MPSPQVSFLSLHFYVAIMLALSINAVFRFKPFSSYYADGDDVFGSYNFWKYANYLLLYGYIAFSGMAFLSAIPVYSGNNQKLVSFDMWVWNDYLSYFQQFWMVAYGLLFWGLNKARDEKDNTDAAVAAKAVIVYDKIWEDIVYNSIGLLAFFSKRTSMQAT